MDHIKQLRIYPPENGTCNLIVIYEIEEPERLSQNGHYLSVDLGLHNLMTCYDSGNGRTFILGRKYLSLERYFHKEIARVQSAWYAQQSERGIKYPKSSKHIQRLYRKKQNTVKDYLHKVTRWIAEYCKKKISAVWLWETSEISVKRKIWGIRPTRSFTDCHITGCISCWNIS